MKNRMKNFISNAKDKVVNWRHDHEWEHHCSVSE